MSIPTLYSILDLMMINYNTSILNDLPDDLRDILYEEANRCLTDPKEPEVSERCAPRDTLMRLINNHRLNNKPVADLIKGPVTLTLHWHPDMKMMIYIFGEKHNTTTDCIRVLLYRKKYMKSMFIEDYMKDLILNTDSYIDFYIEEKAHIGYDPDLSGNSGEKRIDIMINRFRECIADVKTRNANPNCRLSRSHYFDIRQGVIKGKFDIVSQIILILFSLFDEYYYANKPKPEETFVINFAMHINHLFSEFISKIRDTDDDEFSSFWQEELITKYKFLNDKMNRSTMTETIRTFILDEIKLNALKFKKTMQNNLEELYIIFNAFVPKFDTKGRLIKMENISTYFDELTPRYDKKGTLIEIKPRYDKEGKLIKIKHFDKFIICVERFHQALIQITSPIADAYLLSRIFKTFDTKTTNPVKKRDFDEPEKQHNIIIYGGNAHADRCRKFLEDVASFKRLEQNTVEKPIRAKNCLDMTGITQPLFSYTPKDDHPYYDTPYEPMYNVSSEIV